MLPSNLGLDLLIGFVTFRLFEYNFGINFSCYTYLIRNIQAVAKCPPIVPYIQLKGIPLYRVSQEERT